MIAKRRAAARRRRQKQRQHADWAEQAELSLRVDGIEHLLANRSVPRAEVLEGAFGAAARRAEEELQTPAPDGRY